MVNGIPDRNHYVRNTTEQLDGQYSQKNLPDKPAPKPQGAKGPSIMDKTLDGGTLPEVTVTGKKPAPSFSFAHEIEGPKLREISFASIDAAINPEQTSVKNDVAQTRTVEEQGNAAQMKQDLQELIGQEELPEGYTAQYSHDKLQLRMPGGDVMTPRDIAFLADQLAADKAKAQNPAQNDDIAYEVELPEVTVVGQDKSKPNDDIAYEVELPEVTVVGQDKSKPNDDIAYEVELPEVTVVGQDKSKPNDDIAYEVELPEVTVVGQDKSKPNDIAYEVELPGVTVVGKDKSKPNDDIAYEVELPEVTVVGKDKSKPNNDLAMNDAPVHTPKPQGATSPKAPKKAAPKREPLSTKPHPKGHWYRATANQIKDFDRDFKGKTVDQLVDSLSGFSARGPLSAEQQATLRKQMIRMNPSVYDKNGNIKPNADYNKLDIPNIDWLSEEFA